MTTTTFSSEQVETLDAIGLLEEFLRFHSISTDSQFASQVCHCAQWLIDLFSAEGWDTQLYPTAQYPLVVAKTPQFDPNKKTVLIYGHYDVQPPDPLEEWVSPPFQPRRDLEEGKIYARGSADNKGQIMAHIIAALQVWREQRKLPVNLIFLIEGEEEIGSPNLVSFLQEHAQLLKCDALIISDTAMGPGNKPAITYGLRGVVGMEVFLEGPSRDLHSGLFGGTVANPITVAAHLIASLHDAQGRIAIEGIYDQVRPIADWEKTLNAQLEAATPPEGSLAALAGVDTLFGDPDFTPLERVGARPALDINGFGGGYQGEGTKTVLPSKAFFKLTLRLVPDQDPERMLDLIESHLSAQVSRWPGIKMRIQRGHAGPPYFFDPHSAEGAVAQKALEKVFGEKPLFLRDGGTLPILAHFREVLGHDALLIGLANPDAQVHSPNENLLITNYLNGIELSKVLMGCLAGL